MAPRKTILRELTRTYERAGDSSYTRPSAISGFSSRPDKYQRAVNELLQSRLVEGRKDGDGHMTIALNQHRLADVKRELRPLWARPYLWLVVAAALAVGLVAV